MPFFQVQFKETQSMTFGGSDIVHTLLIIIIILDYIVNILSLISFAFHTMFFLKKICSKIKAMENMITFQAADEVFVYGVNSSSESLVVRLARTMNHEAEAWIYLKLKDGKIYKLHKTSGYENSCSDPNREFTCGGLRMHYISPMRRWRIFYNGLLR